MPNGALGKIRHHYACEFLETSHDLATVAELVVVPDIKHGVGALDNSRGRINDPCITVPNKVA